ncbi:MAG: hypothetical protein QM710_10515 [Flavobacterium sp.]
MNNIENKKIPLLAITIAVILIIFFSIIKVKTELSETIDGDDAITTTSKIILFDNEYNFESSIAVCFIIILLSVIAFFYTTDEQLITKAVVIKDKTIEIATSPKERQRRNRFIFYIILFILVGLLWKAFAYYEELKELKRENPYIVFNKWQAEFMGFMHTASIAIPILIAVTIFKLVFLKKRRNKK